MLSRVGFQVGRERNSRKEDELRFEDLNAKFVEFDNSRTQYLQRCYAFAARVADYIEEITGAPGSYEEPTLDTVRRSRKYVQIRLVDQEEGLLKEAGVAQEVVQFEDDGFFNFGVTIALEHAHNSYPKSPTGAKVRCRISANGIETEVNRKDNKFSADADDLAAESCARAVLQCVSDHLDKRYEELFAPSNVGFGIVRNR